MIIKTALELPALAWVSHISDFHRHIELHRERVFHLGMVLGIEKFPELDIMKLQAFLRLHDASKTMAASEKLERYNYRNHIAPLVRLFSFYGKPHESEEAKNLLRGTVEDINAIDQNIANEFFAGHRELSHETVQKFLLIEKIADLVDRSLDPVASEEFHQKLTPASEYIQDGEGIELALWLEERYDLITRDLHMPRLGEYQKISG